MFFRNPIIKKRQKLDALQLTKGQLNGNEYNDLKLSKLRVHNDLGIGLVTRIELQLDCVFNVLIGDPATPAYVLGKFFDVDMVGGDNLAMVKRLGYHHAVREYAQHGRFIGEIPEDLLGATTADQARTITLQFDFDERALGPHRFFRSCPTTWWKTGEIRFKPITDQLALLGAHITLKDVTITPYVEIVDFDLSAVPIPSLVLENYSSDKDPLPSMPGGQYLRALAAIGPDTPTFEDDLSSIVTIQYGKEPAGFPVPKRTDVSEHMRTWMDNYSTDPKPFSTLTGQKEFYRFFDVTRNASGRLHAISLIQPARGHSVKEAPDFGDQRPELEINDNNRAGTPDTIDFLFDQVVDREARHIGLMLEGIRRGASAKFKGDEAHAIIKGLPKPQRGPLLMDLR